MAMNTNMSKVVKEKKKKALEVCNVSASTSHTQYYKRDMYDRDDFKKITEDEFCGLTADSISGSSDTFQCVHGSGGKQYTERGRLKRNLIKKLDPIKIGSEIVKDCPPALGWDMAKKLEFLIKDSVGVQQIDRIQHHLHDFSKTASSGYRIDTLDSLCIILDYLVNTIEKKLPHYRNALKEMLKNIEKPIILILKSDIIRYLDSVRNYIGFLGSLLVMLEDDDLFELVSKGLLYQLSCPDEARGSNAALKPYMFKASRTVLSETVARMTALAKPFRFPTFVKIALLLACDSEQNCYELLMVNIIENIFYRFNPYFPNKCLPPYEINPSGPEDDNITLGESSQNIDTILSLLLVLLKAAKQFIDEDPSLRNVIPSPDEYSQRCFVWAYRFECRAHNLYNRSTLTVITNTLINIFRERLIFISLVLMPDVLSLSVLTELPPRDDWTAGVAFNISQKDVRFKEYLIQLSVEFLKLYPRNSFMVQDRHWVVGLMFLVDPGLSPIRVKWSRALYSDLRKTALQALTLSISTAHPDVPTEVSLIRRLLWYVEWYSECPYDLPVLYWSVRLLQNSMDERPSLYRRSAIQELIQTHGVIIIINLCNSLMNEKLPPVNKKQAIIGLNLRLLTSCLDYDARVSCYVYPHIRWPSYISQFVRRMLSIVLYCFDKSACFSDRWLLSLLNLIWEGIVWKKLQRETFVANNGVYQLLDIISMTDAPIQCLALALVCDVMRAGGAVAQLTTWRASAHATNLQPPLVQPGATIASLIAAIFKSSCEYSQIKIDDRNVIQDLDFPLMTQATQKYMTSPEFIQTRNQRTPFCLAASLMAGSRMPKCYAIFEMLSEDLKEKVDHSDDAYKLYKNIQLTREEETMLVLVSHYLTIKLNETWLETQIQSNGFVPTDTNIVGEYLQIGRGWAKSIQKQQLNVLEKFKKMDGSKESNLYSFLERVRLNTALDSLRLVKTCARAADRETLTHALLHDAVLVYSRRADTMRRLNAPVAQTYRPPLDEFNMVGQNIKVINIAPKRRPKKREVLDFVSHSSPNTLFASKIEMKRPTSNQGDFHDQKTTLATSELLDPDDDLFEPTPRESRESVDSRISLDSVRIEPRKESINEIAVKASSFVVKDSVAKDTPIFPGSGDN